MAKKKRGGDHGGGGGGHDAGGGLRWLLTYADMITLLLALFIYFYSISNVSESKAQDFSENFNRQFGLFTGTKHPITGGRGVLQGLPPSPPSRLTSDTDQEVPIEQIKAMGFTVERADRELRFRITDEFLFGQGSADLKPEARIILANLSVFFNNVVPKHSVRIEGHTDNSEVTSPRLPSNWELSALRAAKITQTLVKDYQVNPLMLSAVGYGPHRPVAGMRDAQTPAEQAANRRVEIVILLEDKKER